MPSIEHLIQQHHGLVSELARYDYASVAPLVGGLLTLPDLHANTLRLDALAHLACYACAGRRTANREALVRCAGRHFVGSPLILLEDPVEDAFIGNVATTFGNFRTFRGIEASGDFWLERLLRPFESADVPDQLRRVIRSVAALLTISDAVAGRLKLSRHTFGSGHLRRRLEIPQWRTLTACAQAVTFSSAEIAQLGVREEDLAPFMFPSESRIRLADQEIGSSDLERWPMVRFGNALVLAAPHLTTTASRRHVIDQIERTSLLERFERLLYAEQVTEWLHLLSRRFGYHPERVVLPAPPDDVPIGYQAVARFDHGKYAHVLMLNGNLRGELRNRHEPDHLTDSQQQALDDHLRDCANMLSKLPEFSAGMTVLTRGGAGRGVVLSLRPIPGDWDLGFASLPDWHTLAACADMSALRFWRMSRHMRWAEDRGLTINDLGGTLNLFACWRANGWRFFLREMPLSNPHKMLMVQQDFACDVRKTARQRRDEHSCPSHAGGDWVRVERRYSHSYFSDDRAAAIYVAPGATLGGRLLGSIETSARIWWISAGTTNPNSSARSVVFRLWDCVLNWMERIAPIVENVFDTLPSGSIWVEVDIPDPEVWSDDSERKLLGQATAGPTAVVWPPERRVVMSLPSGFRNTFHTPDNCAERTLVGCLINAIGELAGMSVTEELRTGVLSGMFHNAEARFFHVVRTDSLVQMLGGSGSPKPDFIPDEDCAQSLIGLASEIGDLPEGGRIRGQVPCLDYLQKVTDTLWQRIERGLALFNRREVLSRCCNALAELERDHEHWNMTARALIGAQKSKTEVLQRAQERRSKRDAASLANRLLIETAMYACPDDQGNPLPDAERLELLAHITNLVLTANHRDAISGGFLPPEVHVFPNGELDVDDRFYESVMTPYLRAVFDRGFEAVARDYERWFPGYDLKIDPETTATLERMEAPFLEEYGLTPQEFVSIGHMFRDQALQRRSLVLEFDGPTLLGLLTDKCRLHEHPSREYLARFCLPPRRAWNKDLPIGCREGDVWPWRFRRQLSALMRPIFEISLNTDKRYMVYPPLVEQSAKYLLHGISESAFPTEHFRSRGMQQFCGDQANRQGNAFSNEVADRMEALGFFTRRQVAMSALGVSDSEGDLGDVDVLAWRRASEDVLIIECKRLRPAISVRDVVDRLDDYRGERDDSFEKHLRRVQWLRSKPAALSMLTGIPTGSIRIEGRLVTSDLVPMQFFSGSPLLPKTVFAFHQLADLARAL